MQFKSASKKFKVLFSIALFLLTIVLFFSFIKFRNSTIRQFNDIREAQSDNTIFFDIHRRPFHVIRGDEDRKYRKLRSISRNLQLAVVAVEDARFFKHFGFDPIRMADIPIQYFRGNGPVHGASTITQQLVKQTLLTPKRTIRRKVKELFMAVALETEFTKKEILEFYLNKVYLGHRNHGVENASLNYFHKSSKELTLAESAFVAGLIKKPEGYSPYTNLNKARERQVLVLKRMRDLKWISTQEYNDAVQERIIIRRRRESDLRMAPYFTNHILLQLQRRYGSDRVYGGGLRIYTTLDRDIQENMEKTVSKRVSQERSFEQVAAVSMEPETGFIKALVGGVDFNNSEFNRATQAQRQPGSSFKPVLYATALSRGIKPSDVFIDEPTQYQSETSDPESGEPSIYEPENFSGDYQGAITVSYALRTSNNVVSVQILNKIGISSLVHAARRFGIQIPGEQGLCLALGCGESTLLQMVGAYSTFANNGKRNKPIFILKITDSEGNILEEYAPEEPVQVLSESQNFQMNRMLQKVIELGTGRAARIGRQAGGKTGTSDAFRDAWFVGYTPELVTGFWIGNDDNTSMDHETGGRTPARLWKGFMNSIEDSTLASRGFELNEEFEEFEICDSSGKIATPWCPNKSWYAMKKGSEPLDFCDLHESEEIELEVCRSSGMLPTRACPLHEIETRRFRHGSEPTHFCDIHPEEGPENTSDDLKPVSAEEIFPEEEDLNVLDEFEGYSPIE